MSAPKDKSKTRGRILPRILVYGGLVALAIWFSPVLVRPMVYPVPRFAVPQPPPSVAAVPLTDAAGKKISAWFLDPENAGPSTPICLFFHGNAENLGTMTASGFFEDWSALGLRVLAVDYPGYGLSEGKPAETALIESGLVALDWLVENHPESPKVVVGWSLGAAVAVQTAAARPEETDALILLSAWSSLHDVASTHFPRWMVKLAVKERYDSVAAAAKVAVPALVIHGERDAIIPADQGKRVAQALPDSRWRPIPHREHNDLWFSKQAWREIESFLHERFPGACAAELP